MKTEEKYLKGMCDFVLEQYDKDHTCIFEEKVFNHAKFLQQKPNLGMFVPAIEVNGVWEVLEENSIFASNDKDYVFKSEKFDQYQQTKINVIFDGWYLDLYNFNEVVTNGLVNLFWFDNIGSWTLSKDIHTIEDLVKYNLKLK